jgi:hypothetical protein
MIRFIVAVFAAVALAGCGGARPETGATSPEPHAVDAAAGLSLHAGVPPRSAVAAAANSQAAAATPLRVIVRWVQVPNPLELMDALELSDPFAWDRRHVISNGLKDPDPALWGLYLAGMDGTTTDLHSTQRAIALDGALAWQGSFITADLSTRKTVANTYAPSSPKEMSFAGRLRVDFASDEVTSSLESQPLDTGNGFAMAGERYFAVLNTSESLQLRLLVFRPLRLRSPDVVYLLDFAGNAWQLEGLSGLSGTRWLAGRRAIIARSSATSQSWLLPVSDGEALGFDLINSEVEIPGSAGKVSAPAAIAFNSFSRPSFRKDIYLFSPDSWTFEFVLSYFEGGGLIWDDEASTLRIYGQDQIVDFAASMLVASPAPPPLEPGRSTTSAFASPAGRFVVRTSARDMQAEKCKGLPAELVVDDLASRTTTRLRDCDGGTGTSSGIWLDEHRFLLEKRYCIFPCARSRYGYILDDVSTGELQELTLQADARAAVTTDGRIAVLDAGLRVYDASGRLLLDYGALPDGFRAVAAAWNADGSALAFVLGPRNWTPSRRGGPFATRS